MRRKKTYQHREERPNHVQMIVGAGDEFIERCLECLGLCMGRLHTIHSLQKRQQYCAAGDLPTELCAKRCEYPFMRLIQEKCLHDVASISFVLSVDFSERQ